MPESAVEVRPAAEDEIAALTALLVAQLRDHQVRTPEAKLASAVEAVLRHPERGRILVAVERGSVVGMAALSFVWPLEHGGRSAWLEELYVQPAARGRGIGTRLLHAALRVAAESGAVAVDLEVDADHQRAARLYAREGFRPLPRARWVRTLETIAAPRPEGPPAEITGGCFCGAIRYRVNAAPRDVVHCHCGICRRTTGAPFVTWATFPAAAFVFTAGVPAELRATPLGGAPVVRRLRYGAGLPRGGTAELGRRHGREHGSAGPGRPRRPHLDLEPARLAPRRR